MTTYLRPTVAGLAMCSFLGLGIAGCSGNKEEGAKSDQTAVTNFSWKKHDTPPGADPSVPDSLGGAGFENIAAALGFTTYNVPPEDVKYFGDSRAVKGGTLKHIVGRFPNTFRILGQNSNYTENNTISGLCYEGLLTLDPVKTEFMPALATHWKISDDKLTFTFRINPNARFWDGKPVTAQDVIATWRLHMDETILSPSDQLTYGKFEEPVALSKYIVQVKSKQLNWRNFLYFAASMRILSADEIGNLTGKEFIEKFHYTMPVGSGRYIILNEDVVNQQKYAFTRRPDYWDEQNPLNKYSANFDKIQMEVVLDNWQLTYEKFKKGEQDFFQHVNLGLDSWVGDSTYDAAKYGWIKKLRVFNQKPAGTLGFTMNMRKPPFNDIRVREAMGYLLNREAIISKILYNEARSLSSYYANTPYENPANPKAEFNPDKAAKLLAEAGWKTRNKEGVLVKDGKPFVMEIGIPKVIEKFVTPYQEELRKVGIDLKIKFEDGNTLFKNAMERNFELYFMNWGGLVFPNPETSLHSRLAKTNNNNNLSGFANARVDELCAQYDTTFSQAQRETIIREIDGIVRNTYADILGWYHPCLRVAYWDRFGMPDYVFGRFTSDPLDGIVAYWWVDPAKEKALEDAKKNKTSLGKHEIKDSRFWLDFAKK